MNIGILTSTDLQLRQQLATNGSTAEAKAPPAENEAVAVAKPRPTGNVAPSVKFPSLRAALDARIAVDVSSGQLSAGDAATVKATLDDVDDRRSGPAAIAAPAAGQAGYISQDRQQVARAYLATIGRGTLIDRWA